MHYINDLIAKMKPRLEETQYTEKQWDKVEKQIDTKLPEDYKQFINVYGTGGINDFLWILTPFSEDENINFFTKGVVLREAYNISKQKSPDYFIHSVYPDSQGLLPWGYTDNGDELYWITYDNPTLWKIVIYESRSSKYLEYGIGMIEFIYKLASHDLDCSILPEDFLKSDYQFINY